MTTVHDGEELYRRLHAPPADTTPDDLKAQRGSIGYGRLLMLAQRGNQDALKVVREHARRGDPAAQHVVDTTGSGSLEITGGAVAQPDNLGPDVA